MQLIKEISGVTEAIQGQTPGSGTPASLYQQMTTNATISSRDFFEFFFGVRRKRDFKRLWLCRVNAAARIEGLTYSKLKNRLKQNSIDLNLKMLAQIALLDKSTFSLIVNQL